MAALGLVVALVVGLVSLSRMGTIAEDADNIRARGLEPVTEINQVRRAFLETRIDALADEMQRVEGPEHEAFLADIDAVDAALTTFVDDTALSAQELGFVDTFRTNWGSYVVQVKGPLLDLARQQEWEEYTTLRIEQIKPIATALHDALTGFEEAAARADASLENAHASYNRARLWMFVTLAFGLLIAIGVVLLVANRIAGPIKRTAAALRALADGDLDQQLHLDRQDELGQMADALNIAPRKLREAMTGMGGTAPDARVGRRGAHGRVRAAVGLGREVRVAGQHRLDGGGPGLHQRADGGRGHRGDGCLDPRDRQELARGRRRCRSGRRGRGVHDRDDGQDRDLEPARSATSSS